MSAARTAQHLECFSDPVIVAEAFYQVSVAAFAFTLFIGKVPADPTDPKQKDIFQKLTQEALVFLFRCQSL